MVGTWQKRAILVTVFSLAFYLSLAHASGLPWENPTPRIDLAAKGVFNANRTGHTNVAGFTGYLRNVNSQKVHSDFFLNTNSCASCHITHIGQGDGLLFQASVYNTCSACHFDSSMNTYNILTDSTLPGGRFYDEDFDMSGRSGVSYHAVTGSKTLANAPGADISTPGMWDKPFTCGSCHAPHGSYGRKQLNLNPNGKAKRYTDTLTVTDATYVRYVPSTYTGKTPWLYYDSSSTAFANYGLVIKNSLGETVTDAFFVSYRDGYVEKQGDPGPEPYTITFSQAVTVDIETVTNNGVEDVIYRSGTTDFCGACHTGYLSTDEQGRTVTKHLNFTHVINEDLYASYISTGVISPDTRLRLEKARDTAEQRLVCLTCHFPHGTDTELMKDRNFQPMYTAGETVPTLTHLLRFGEKNGAWEACYTCHDTGGPVTTTAGTTTTDTTTTGTTTTDTTTGTSEPLPQ
jgi:hypothetical protein